MLTLSKMNKAIYHNDFRLFLIQIAHDDSSMDNFRTSYHDHHVLRHDSDT